VVGSASRVPTPLTRKPHCRPDFGGTLALGKFSGLSKTMTNRTRLALLSNLQIKNSFVVFSPEIYAMAHAQLHATEFQESQGRSKALAVSASC
jgi:hypothetical protein